MVTLTIISDPAGASVYTQEEGQRNLLGTTPLTLEREKGMTLSYTVEASPSDYKNFEGKLAFNESTNVSVWLDRVTLAEKFWSNVDTVSVKEFNTFGDEYFDEPVIFRGEFASIDNTWVSNLPWVKTGEDFVGFRTFYNGEEYKEWMGIFLQDDTTDDYVLFQRIFATREVFKDFFLGLERNTPLSVKGLAFEFGNGNWAGLLLISVTNLATGQTVEMDVDDEFYRRHMPSLPNQTFANNTPQAEPQLTNPDANSNLPEIVSMADAYLISGESANIEEAIKRYENQVNYYDLGIISIDEVLKDKTAYFAQFPVRSYQRTGNVSVTPISLTSWRVNFDYTYQVKNAEKDLSGTAFTELVITKIDGELYISSEKGGIY